VAPRRNELAERTRSSLCRANASSSGSAITSPPRPSVYPSMLTMVQTTILPISISPSSGADTQGTEPTSPSRQVEGDVVGARCQAGRHGGQSLRGTPPRRVDVAGLRGARGGQQRHLRRLLVHRLPPRGTAGSATANRDRKLERVRAGTTHAALVFEGDAASAGASSARPTSCRASRTAWRTRRGSPSLPDWRIACNYAGKGHRRQGVATAGPGRRARPDRRARGRPGRGLPGGRRVGARRVSCSTVRSPPTSGWGSSATARSASTGGSSRGRSTQLEEETSWLRSAHPTTCRAPGSSRPTCRAPGSSAPTCPAS
jgi:hypothetical protein